MVRQVRANCGIARLAGGTGRHGNHDIGSWFLRIPLGSIWEESDILVRLAGATSMNQEPIRRYAGKCRLRQPGAITASLDPFLAMHCRWPRFLLPATPIGVERGSLTSIARPRISDDPRWSDSVHQRPLLGAQRA